MTSETRQPVYNPDLRMVSTSFSRQRHLFNADALRFPPEVGAAQDVEDVFETLVLLFTRPTSGASTMCSWSSGYIGTHLDQLE